MLFRSVAEGLGTMIRTAVNTVTQPKDQGGLEPMSHKVANHPIFNRGEGNKVDSVHVDPSQVAYEKKDSKDDIVVNERRDAEQIIEPSPHTSQAQAGESSSATKPAQQDGEDDDDDGGENKVVDNEVDDFVTEQLYIHSKLMIVDDRIIIIGSGKKNSCGKGHCERHN